MRTEERVRPGWKISHGVWYTARGGLSPILAPGNPQHTSLTKHCFEIQISQRRQVNALSVEAHQGGHSGTGTAPLLVLMDSLVMVDLKPMFLTQTATQHRPCLQHL